MQHSITPYEITLFHIFLLIKQIADQYTMDDKYSMIVWLLCGKPKHA